MTYGVLKDDQYTTKLRCGDTVIGGGHRRPEPYDLEVSSRGTWCIILRMKRLRFIVPGLLISGLLLPGCGKEAESTSTGFGDLGDNEGNSEQIIELDASNCGAINHMEHLHLLIDLTSGARRGDLSVILKSPAGTQSVLLGPRPEDQIRTGFSLFKTWPMMSVHYWGEPVVVPDVGGVWTLTIDNRGDKPCVLNDWQIRFYGTETDPQPNTPETETEEEETTTFEDIPTDEEDTIVEISADEYEESEDTTAFTEDFENLEILNERVTPVE